MLILSNSDVDVSDLQFPTTEPDINNRLESLCLSMTEHALGGGFLTLGPVYKRLRLIIL